MSKKKSFFKANAAIMLILFIGILILAVLVRRCIPYHAKYKSSIGNPQHTQEAPEER
jgi:hypothetical protein